MERPYQSAVKTQRYKAINMVTKDPYAALRFKEFNVFLLYKRKTLNSLNLSAA